ncbi:hypothetical protein NPX13_g10442 [Xylaria arbuscula]|uniref:Uncharacterized protein n=1 Tax=Xylaria arbuscula TaxID=114810 RepID=A0A9W8THX5_9PEZI|nr:hypothetical protein NPX13_g10442 [Xylaria arbuscula]
MASSSTLISPIVGAILGALGATAVTVIGALITARHNQGNGLAERSISDAENGQYDMGSINNSPSTFHYPPSVATAAHGGAQSNRPRRWSN